MLWIGAITKNDVILYKRMIRHYPHQNTEANQQWFPRNQETPNNEDADN